MWKTIAIGILILLMAGAGLLYLNRKAVIL